MFPGETWEVLLRPAKRVEIGNDGHVRRRLPGPDRPAPVGKAVAAWNFRRTSRSMIFSPGSGRAPLPPYIKRRRDRSRSQQDLERYQTVYARVKGSVAAPTAGLHFTEEVLDHLRSRAVGIAPVTLHVGYGTFLPIETERVEDHVMEEEHYHDRRGDGPDGQRGETGHRRGDDLDPRPRIRRR